MSKLTATIEGTKTGKLADSLNVQLANWSVLYVKLHHFHWYVTGPHFSVLHAKFEELYDLAAESLDDLAERILTIGGKPASTMKEYLSLATIREAEGPKGPNGCWPRRSRI